MACVARFIDCNGDDPATGPGCRDQSRTSFIHRHVSSSCMPDFVWIPQVLAYTHEQKRQRGVDAMLLNLYQPIIW